MFARLISKFNLSLPQILISSLVVKVFLFMSGHIDFLELWHNLSFGHQWLFGDACKPRGYTNVKFFREDTGIPFPRSRFLKLKRVIFVVKLVLAKQKVKHLLM